MDSREPGGLQSVGLQRVGYDWMTDTHSDDEKMEVFVLLESEGSGNPF